MKYIQKHFFDKLRKRIYKVIQNTCFSLQQYKMSIEWAQNVVATK